MSAPTFYDKTDYVNFPGYRESGTCETNSDTNMIEQPISFVFHNTGDYYLGGAVNTALDYADHYHNGYLDYDCNVGGPTCAYFYADNKNVVQMIDVGIASWATCTPEYNRQYYSFEICDDFIGPISVGGGDNILPSYTQNADFQLAEENAFWYAAKFVKSQNLDITKIGIHSDFCSTDCPKRSKSIHGGTISTREYIKSRVQFYYDNPSKTPIIDDSNTGTNIIPTEYNVIAPLVSKYDTPNLESRNTDLGYLEQGDVVQTFFTSNG